MLETGTNLQNRYRIEKQIGQGGMGAVYVAVDERFGSTVAIKETLFLGEQFEKAFEREARLLNSLRHPALPNVRDYFSEEHNQYLVMEFIPGDDLFEKLEKNGEAFALEDVLNWTRQLLEALDFLHNQEFPVIHRDIKPQNLKLTPAGQIILLDFGLAKGNPNDAGNLTNTKSIFGYSRNYASLEQMQGTGTDPRSDIYSLAATVYHLATGNPPVDALTRATSVLSEQSDPLVSAHQFNEKIPNGIANILLNAMNLNANQRPASAKEMLEMLDNFEEYEDLENTNVKIANAVPVNLFNQETQILSFENENLTAQKKAGITIDKKEIETEINENKFSSNKYETNVVSKNFYENPKPDSRRFVLTVGAILSLLLAAIGVTAFYYTTSANKSGSQFQSDETENNKNSGEIIIKTENTDLNFDNTEAAAVNVNSNISTVQENPVKAEVKVATPPKTKTENTKTNGKNDSNSDPEFVFFDPEEGNVRIKGDRIETDKVIISEKGVIFKKPPVPPKTPANNGQSLPPEQFEKLTPAQRERLNIIRSETKRRRQINKRQQDLTVVPNPPPQSN